MVQGIKIPLVKKPFQTRIPSSWVEGQDAHLIESEVQTMLEKNVIVKSFHCTGQFLSPVFLVPKKDGGNRPVINLKRLNSCVEYQHFQMEGVQSLKTLIQKDDFMVKLDLKDAYFTVPGPSNSSEISEVSLGGPNIHVCGNAFGLAPGPRFLHQTDETSGSPHEKDRCPNGNLLGRHDSYEPIQGKAPDGHTLSEIPVGPTRISDKHREISLDPYSRDRIFRLSSQLNGNDIVTTSKEGVKGHRQVSSFVDKQNSHSEGDVGDFGSHDLDLASGGSAPLHLQTSSNVPNPDLPIGQILPSVSNSLLGLSGELRWWICQMESWNGKAIINAGPDLIIETDASKKGWGAASGTSRVQGLWTSEERTLSYQCAGTEGSTISPEILHKGKFPKSCSSETRQSDSGSIYIQKMGGPNLASYCC
ncbi:uncharacterized protein [Argopecten irradians]|uniref:uncharacterized protein n=1 Tax=Argopecten irradians TaxID=31199 RepID=UPI00371A065A